jgi:UTP--glucose-1-phosphate uridylyltransferase
VIRLSAARPGLPCAWPDKNLVPARPIAFGGLMTRSIRKAVFPVAGLGTRFLPATKSIPKEMLTVVDRPVLQHVVEEAREAGIEHFIFVTGRNKAVIEDHFDISYELDDTLKKRGKLKELQALTAELPAPGATSFTRQQVPLGLGHAVWCAREIVGDEPFAVLLPDMVTMAATPKGRRCLAQCIAAYEKHGSNIIAVEEVPPEETHHYGVVSIGKDFGHTFEITGMVEKPPRGTAPSNLIISGRYVLGPEIFPILAKSEKGAGGEIQLTDGMKALARSQAFHGVRFDGKTYDCGVKLGFLAANVAFALADPELAPLLKMELKKVLGIPNTNRSKTDG